MAAQLKGSRLLKTSGCVWSFGLFDHDLLMLFVTNGCFLIFILDNINNLRYTPVGVCLSVNSVSRSFDIK